ncbi:MAG: hypothetical protein JWP87_4210 [Labilithrix sp.]|nr:hypothetical protein [Labilithrix sp.]
MHVRAPVVVGILVLPALLGVLAIASAGCGDLKNANASGDGGAGDFFEGGVDPADGGGPGDLDGSLKVTVDTLVTGRSRIGARSTAGYRPWRSGLVASGDDVYWVESGTAPGLYKASGVQPCTGASCVEKIATFTRPSAFTASATHVYVADTIAIKRIAFAGTHALETVVSHNEEIVNLATAGTKVFWTADTDPAMRSTVIGGTTSTPINSNGTPVATAVSGDRLFWAGVDISGQIGAMQSVGTNGTGAREVNRFSDGFHTMRGNATYLYYGKDSPGSIHRITLANDRDEVVDKDALGVTDFAIDDAYAYWVEPGDGDLTNGRVRRVAHDSKTAETLAVGIPFPVAIAISGNSVYVGSAGTKSAAYADGKILRLSVSE